MKDLNSAAAFQLIIWRFKMKEKQNDSRSLADVIHSGMKNAFVTAALIFGAYRPA